MLNSGVYPRRSASRRSRRAQVEWNVETIRADGTASTTIWTGRQAAAAEVEELLGMLADPFGSTSTTVAAILSVMRSFRRTVPSPAEADDEDSLSKVKNTHKS